MKRPWIGWKGSATNNIADEARCALAPVRGSSSQSQGPHPVINILIGVNALKELGTPIVRWLQTAL
jgi:hypothetical protein